MSKLTKFLGGTALAALLGVSFVALAQAADGGVYAPPQNVGGLISNLAAAWGMMKAHAWMGFSLIIVQALIFGVKQLDALDGAMSKWGTLIITVLSAAAAVLGTIVGGLPAQEAMMTFFVVGAPKFVHDFMTEVGILEHSSKPAPDAPAKTPVPK
jgi:hypothetical protein